MIVCLAATARHCHNSSRVFLKGLFDCTRWLRLPFQKNSNLTDVNFCLIVLKSSLPRPFGIMASPLFVSPRGGWRTRGHQTTVVGARAVITIMDNTCDDTILCCSIFCLDFMDSVLWNRLRWPYWKKSENAKCSNQNDDQKFVDSLNIWIVNNFGWYTLKASPKDTLQPDEAYTPISCRPLPITFSSTPGSVLITLLQCEHDLTLLSICNYS